MELIKPSEFKKAFVDIDWAMKIINSGLSKGLLEFNIWGINDIDGEFKPANTVALEQIRKELLDAGWNIENSEVRYPERTGTTSYIYIKLCTP